MDDAAMNTSEPRWCRVCGVREDGEAAVSFEGVFDLPDLCPLMEEAGNAWEERHCLNNLLVREEVG